MDMEEEENAPGEDDGMPPIPHVEVVRERDREIEIQDPWAEDQVQQREAVEGQGRKRTAVIPR
jgi:hypothetical protein